VKRSPLRRKTPIRSRAPLRRRGLARVRARTGTRVSVKSAKAKAWMWFSRFIRLRDSKDGMAKCCSCDYTGSVFGKGCLQAGHFVSGRNNSILYDPRNCHAQCSMCNRWKGGAPVPYEMFMRARYGLEVVEELKQRSLLVVPMSALDHLAVAKQYEKAVSDLGGWPCQTGT